MQIFNDRLFIEMYSENEGHLHGFRRVLVTGQTAYQQVEIVDTYEYGRCLLLDGKMQSGQVDEHIYHELLVHPAMVAHPLPKRILIIGGGEGATLREVLRHGSVERVDMLEIDEKVVEFAKRHLSEWHRGAFDDPRLRLIVGDGRRFVQETAEQYDVVLIDASDPSYDGPAYLLYTRQFYQEVAKRLSPAGIVATQAGAASPTCGEIMASIHTTLGKAFPVVRAHEAFIPSFGYPWGFCLGSMQSDPARLAPAEVDRRLNERGVQELKAFDGTTHCRQFMPDKTLRTMLASQGRLIKDQQPIYTPI
ncbi:MAG: polyamine aminopropyltransferase [candidate division FCPU426 bacterium]